MFWHSGSMHLEQTLQRIWTCHSIVTLWDSKRFEIRPTGADFLLSPSHALDASYPTLQTERLLRTQAASAHTMSSSETVAIRLAIKGIPSATLALSWRLHGGEPETCAYAWCRLVAKAKPARAEPHIALLSCFTYMVI